MAERFDLGAYLKRAVPESGTGQPVLETVDIDRIRGDDRNFYQLDGIEELAANIQLLGLQQPPVVRRDGDRLVLVSGHRRLAALRLLVKEGAEQFRQVPVLIQERPGSEAMQELALIFANRDTRRMTSPEVARQAERVQELLYRLKDEGVEFPGRMRDHVAEACRVTRTRLGNLKVIRQGLAGELLPLWEKGDISEDTALKLARLPEHIGAGTVRRMQQLARALGCSLDYLFGLDDRPEPEPAAESGGWRKGEPPEGTRVLCLFRGSSGRCFHRALWFDRGRYWFDEDRELEAQMRPEGWFPMPETDC